jgi:hypothetical protein
MFRDAIRQFAVGRGSEHDLPPRCVFGTQEFNHLTSVGQTRCFRTGLAGQLPLQIRSAGQQPVRNQKQQLRLGLQQDKDRFPKQIAL